MRDAADGTEACRPADAFCGVAAAEREGAGAYGASGRAARCAASRAVAFQGDGEGRTPALIITAPDTETYDALMAQMIAEHPNVKRFTTNVALSVAKRGLTVPVPLEPEE